MAVLLAIAVNEDGYREVLGAAEGMKEDKAGWVRFFQCLRGRGLEGVQLIVGDKCLGMLETVGEVFPEAKYQRCIERMNRESRRRTLDTTCHQVTEQLFFLNRKYLKFCVTKNKERIL